MKKTKRIGRKALIGALMFFRRDRMNKVDRVIMDDLLSELSARAEHAKAWQTYQTRRLDALTDAPKKKKAAKSR